MELSQQHLETHSPSMLCLPHAGQWPACTFAIAPSSAYLIVRLLCCRYKLVVATTEAVLLAHAAESAAVPPRKLSWRGRAPAQAAQPEQDAATCACWLGAKGDAFAVGYASGVVRLYSIPELALGG